MDYALDENGLRITPYKGGSGFCLQCNAPVISKCGDIMIHHWAHKNTGDCDYSRKAKNKSAWHIEMQNRFPTHLHEIRVVNEETGKVHVADIKLDNGLVIEIQHSMISPEDVRAREKHYGPNMVWIVNCNPNTPFIGTKYNMYIKYYGVDEGYPRGLGFYQIYRKRHLVKLNRFSRPVILYIENDKNQQFVMFPGISEVFKLPKFEDYKDGLSFLGGNEADIRKELMIRHEKRSAYREEKSELQNLYYEHSRKLFRKTQDCPYSDPARRQFLSNLRDKITSLDTYEKQKESLRQTIIEVQDALDDYDAKAKRLADIQKLKAEEELKQRLEQQRLINEEKRIHSELLNSCKELVSNRLNKCTELRLVLTRVENFFVTASTIYFDKLQSYKGYINDLVLYLQPLDDELPNLVLTSDVLSELLDDINNKLRDLPIASIRINALANDIKLNCKERELTILEKERYKKYSDYEETLSDLDLALIYSKTRGYFNKNKAA